VTWRKARRFEEALPWFGSLLDGDDTDGLIYLGPSYRRRARIYDELGRTDKCAAHSDWTMM